jgi:hypothetical protein
MDISVWADNFKLSIFRELRTRVAMASAITSRLWAATPTSKEWSTDLSRSKAQFLNFSALLKPMGGVLLADLAKKNFTVPGPKGTTWLLPFRVQLFDSERSSHY